LPPATGSGFLPGSGHHLQGDAEGLHTRMKNAHSTTRIRRLEVEVMLDQRIKNLRSRGQHSGMRGNVARVVTAAHHKHLSFAAVSHWLSE